MKVNLEYMSERKVFFNFRINNLANQIILLRSIQTARDPHERWTSSYYNLGAYKGQFTKIPNDATLDEAIGLLLLAMEEKWPDVTYD